MTNEQYKRLDEIDNKMLDGKEITKEERLERLEIISKNGKEI